MDVISGTASDLESIVPSVMLLACFLFVVTGVLYFIYGLFFAQTGGKLKKDEQGGDDFDPETGQQGGWNTGCYERPFPLRQRGHMSNEHHQQQQLYSQQHQQLQYQQYTAPVHVPLFCSVLPGQPTGAPGGAAAAEHLPAPHMLPRPKQRRRGDYPSGPAQHHHHHHYHKGGGSRSASRDSAEGLGAHAPTVFNPHAGAGGGAAHLAGRRPSATAVDVAGEPTLTPPHPHLLPLPPHGRSHPHYAAQPGPRAVPLPLPPGLMSPMPPFAAARVAAVAESAEASAPLPVPVPVPSGGVRYVGSGDDEDDFLFDLRREALFSADGQGQGQGTASADCEGGGPMAATATAASAAAGAGGLRASKPLYRLNPRFSPHTALLSSSSLGADGDDNGGGGGDGRGPDEDTRVRDMMAPPRMMAATEGIGGASSGALVEALPNLAGIASAPVAPPPSSTLKLELHELSLDRVLGGGAFGQVWAGTWRGTPVAVKVLSAVCQRSLPAHVLSAFEDEVNMLASLRHPNICLYMGACLAPPSRAIVTELVARGSLWECLRTPNLFASDGRVGAGLGPHQASTSAGPYEGFHWPRWAVRRVLDDTCRVLIYLHSHSPPIIHRDLKSANLLLDDSFHVKICDFGLARLRDLNTTMTANVGTTNWMSPEVIRGHAYRESADVFSLAVVAWEVLTGRCPFEGSSPLDVALAVAQRGARLVLPDGCTDEQRQLMHRCWSEDPTLRPTAAEVLVAVGRAFPM